MRYLVTARVRPGREADLLAAIDACTLGRGSVAEGEYLRNMADARLFGDGSARWVEVCFCAVPLDEEREYWERYFDIVSVKDAHTRARCRDLTGVEDWACCGCDCSARLEDHLAARGESFQESLRCRVGATA